MKIAVLGSAPSTILKAPFGDPSWEIWACSPGAYPHLARVSEFWEVHRWEPGVVGKPQTQKPWFSPEYVLWMRQQAPVVWVTDEAAMRDLPNARMLPWRDLVNRYGHYCWTSSIAYMLAMAIDKITAKRAEREAVRKARREYELHAGAAMQHSPEALVDEHDVIGLWGVDMAANEELYSGQRAACQFFLQVICGLGIDFYIPPESDLAVPPPMYGVSETNHRAIKYLERERELESRLAQTNAQAQGLRDQALFIQGALDDMKYHRTMWLHEGDALSFDFAAVFPALAKGKEVLEAQERVVQPVSEASVVADPVVTTALDQSTPPSTAEPLWAAPVTSISSTQTS